MEVNGRLDFRNGKL